MKRPTNQHDSGQEVRIGCGPNLMVVVRDVISEVPIAARVRQKLIEPAKQSAPTARPAHALYQIARKFQSRLKMNLRLRVERRLSIRSGAARSAGLPIPSFLAGRTSNSLQRPNTTQ